LQNFRKERLAMVEGQLRRRGISDQRVLEAMAKIPRHAFVSPDYQTAAYEDRPLPIGEGQTISQPYMVAVMTQSLSLKGEERVLEIGTGSGYQTALLAELAKAIFTIERIRALIQRAEENLEELGYKNILFFCGDGTKGWPEKAPFDGIIVTAGAPEIPQPLTSQLADGGRLVIPVGPRYTQTLYVVTRKGTQFTEEEVTGCVFVPLVGAYGWKEEGWPQS
jgi:protein-L-isoaspartate(D-aspartate) O-methyltransferase